MKRIEKIISEQFNYSRKEIKKLVSSGKVFVDNELVKNIKDKYDETKITIRINDKELCIKEHIYFLLNKPKGYVSSTETKDQKTVIDLVPEEYKTRFIFPAGRLDKDTTGLMLITDDGEFAHNILSPKKHVKKEYEVTIDIPLTTNMVDGFKNGIKLNDGECKSADLKIIGDHTANVILTEGRYHQIKRMFGCYGAKVTELKRIRIGNLYLPDDIELGKGREATTEELKKIQEL